MRLLTTARAMSRRKARERDGLFVAEGVRAVEELLASPLEIVGVLCAPQLAGASRGAALLACLGSVTSEVTHVTEREFASAASTESPQGVLAVARAPRRTLAALVATDPLRILVLDAIQDPGNVGTLVRTAHALGVDATVALPGTVDVWNAKVVRSAMGSLFRHFVVDASPDDLRSYTTEHAVTIWGADSHGPPLGSADVPGRTALVVGNEGSGLSPHVREMCDALTALQIRDDVESLNVAVAAGILMHGMRPR